MKNNNIKKEKKKCLYCNKTLVAIGNKRLNGKLSITDWENRKYHKKCYLEKKNLTDDLRNIEIVQEYLDLYCFNKN